MLSRDKPVEVYKLIFYFDRQQIRHLLCSVINHHKTLLISQIIITNICLSPKLRIYYFCDIIKVHLSATDTESYTCLKALTVQKQKTIKDPHTEQKLKDGAILWVGRLCKLFLQQKVASV